MNSRRLILLSAIGLFAFLAIVTSIPLHPAAAPAASGHGLGAMVIADTNTTSNTTSEPWWERPFTDVWGAFTSVGSDASYWLSKGIGGTYNYITGSISNFFGNVALNVVETTINGVLSAILSVVQVLGAEISTLIGSLITTIVDFALSPMLGPFAPILALVFLLAIAVAVILVIRLITDIA